MGRPSKFDRDAAVKIAMNEMWSKGFEVTSVQALSETLGIKRSSFYNAFGSREALIDEALDLYFSRTADGIWVDIEPDVPVLPLLAAMVKRLCKERANDASGRGCMAVNGLADTNPANKNAYERIEAMLEERFSRLDVLLQRAAETGEIEDDGKVHEKVLALQSMLLGLNMMARMDRTELDLWAAARQTLIGLGLYYEDKAA